MHNTKLNIYLVANEKALRLLDHKHVTSTLHSALSHILGKDIQPIALNLALKDSPHLDSSQAYKDKYPYIPATLSTSYPPTIRKFCPARDPADFIYTDGSQVTGNPVLGAAVIYPKTRTITHIEIKSQEERHTINRAELAAITIALEANKLDHSISILTDSAFSINTIRKYAIDPLSFQYHPHKHLLQMADNIIHTRDNSGLTTFIGEVKSHTGCYLQ
jgi:ribonuclease HI